MTIEIRAAREDDWPGLLEIEQSRYGQSGYSPYFLRMVPLVFGATCLVANDGGLLVGYSLGAPESGRPERAWILSLAVRPAAGRQGIGTKLATACIDALRDRGAVEVQLTVAPDNEVAVRLYNSLGFAVERTDAGFFGPGTERLLMRLPLSPVAS